MDYRTQSDLPRGIRNNNPGNIKSGQGWKGVVGTDGTFDIFSDDTWGLRALATDISNKVGKDGLTTISQIISVYAPPSENDTSNYISDVASQVGIGADDQIDLSTDLSPMIRAIVMHENGQQGAIISDEDIAQGISMMGNGPAVLASEAGSALINNTNNTAIWVGAAAIAAMLIYSARRR